MVDGKKLVSVVVPIFNEVSMVEEIYTRVDRVFKDMCNYAYELVFFDDGSTDGTREAVEELCAKNDTVKAVFYSKNIGYLKNTFYCMQQAKGDCAIILHADLQNPPEIIPQFIEKWEKGSQVVLGVKNQSRENKIMYFLRTVFYFFMIKIFGVKLIPHATEYELFDKSFVSVLKNIEDNTPFLRGIVIEYATKKDVVLYTQDKRKKGRSKFNLNKYYDFAICGITHCSKRIPRIILSVSIVALILGALEFFINVLPKVANISALELSNCIILRALFLGFWFFMIMFSLLFEFLVNIMENSIKKPFAVEDKRINY